ncbi:MAG: hypothetical protein KDK24_08785 [Pseudooceanicola sp.]|nr:hypothetical protein [Pseudooceanicola sp.]
MPTTRPAKTDDIPQLTDLLLAGARRRHSADPILWALAGNAHAEVAKALTHALAAENQPFRQSWIVAREGTTLTGVAHTMSVPVPPIYAAEIPPGLILPDTTLTEDAPDGTLDALLDAAEADLRAGGARTLLASHVPGDGLQTALNQRGYASLTLYLSRTDLGDRDPARPVRPATDADIPGIVARSAEHRRIIAEIDPFWTTHPEADTRFAAWMRRSLTLTDRDMLVTGAPEMQGYAIAQPASRLHFPPSHPITGIGVIDDFYHTDLADPAHLADNGAGAASLLCAAEAALARRGVGAAFVVCPAEWPSKVGLLHQAGYTTAMEWLVKR